MKTYRIYGEYIQRVYIDVEAQDHELACDIAADLPAGEWTLINKPEIDITEVE